MRKDQRKRRWSSINQLQVEPDIIQHPHQRGERGRNLVKIKAEEDLISLPGSERSCQFNSSGLVIAKKSLNCGFLHGVAVVNEKLYAASHADNRGIYVVNFPD